MEESYPRRESHFAHKFCRLVMKSCVATDLGQDVALLLMGIAMVEDSKRYSGAVSYYNEQLAPVLGFANVKALQRARERAVGAGWLTYIAGARGRPARYWVNIPAESTALDDAGMGSEVEELRTDTRSKSTRNTSTECPQSVLNLSTVCPTIIPSPVPDPKHTHTHAVGDPWQASVTIPFGWSAELTLAAMAKWRTFRAGEDGRPPQAMQLEEMGRDAASSGWDDIRFAKSIDLAIARGAKHPIDPHNNHANKQRNGRSSEQPQPAKPAPKVGDVTGFSAPLPSPELQRQIELCEAAKAKALAEGKTPEEAREVARQLARELSRAERKAIA